jgi:16S rRNA (uracil1498-N3)-methyltransferase
MIRIFLHPETLTSEQITITGDQAKHLNVLRVKSGEIITAFDGLGFKYECKIIHSHKKEVLAMKISKEPYSVESPVSVTLAQGLPKADKMDFIVQKTTELGVKKIIPLITERSQVRRTEKVERWKKIALSSSQQSGRDSVPDIDIPVRLEDFLDQQIPPSAMGYIEDIKGIELDSHIGIIFSENKKERNLKEILCEHNEIKNITLIIGPEGGLTHQELSAAVEKGFVEASLGPRILRTETAPVTALSIIQYELGDMG